MAEEEQGSVRFGAPEQPAAAAPRGRWWRWLLGLLAALVLLAGGLFALVDTAPGHRFVAARIAALAPQSGLRISVGRIDGSLWSAATIRDLTLSDPAGPFLTVPETALDWRPLAWFSRGLDIRAVTLRRGRLLRLPRLKPSLPGGSVLPGFDIRVDRLAVERFTVDPAVAGERRMVDASGRVLVQSGRVLADLDVRPGGGDRLSLHVDGMPDADKLALNLDYAAPRGGLFAALTRSDAAMTARIGGTGSWTKWDGFAVAQRDGQPLTALRLTNRAGRWRIAGQARPAGLVSGLPGRALGDLVNVVAEGTMAARVLDGSLRVQTPVLHGTARGALDLAGNAARAVRVAAVLDRPAALLATPELDGLALDATISGPFKALDIDHRLAARSLRAGTVVASDLLQQGRARLVNGRLELPLALTAARVATGAAAVDPRLIGGRAGGLLVMQNGQLASENLAIAFPGLAAQLVLRSDLAKGTVGLAGPVSARGLALANLGTLDATAGIVLGAGGGGPWKLDAKVAGALPRLANATLQTLTGGAVRFAGNLSTGADRPLLIRGGLIQSPRLTMALDGSRRADGLVDLAGRGRSADYGPFTFTAGLDRSGIKAGLVLADPLPAAGLKDVRLTIVPAGNGLHITTSGQSMLGAFTGAAGLALPSGGVVKLGIEQLTVAQTGISGGLTLNGGLASGTLNLAGGGLDGTIALAPEAGAQGVAVNLAARNAKFGGPAPLSLANGRIEGKGVLAKGRTTIDATAYAEGLSAGSLFIGRLAARVGLVNGSGRYTASLAGRRGSRFDVQTTGTIAPDRITLIAGGSYAGRPLTMPRRAVLTRDGTGWRLAPTQVAFAGGVLIADGHVLGGPTALHLQLANMPLALTDIVVSDLGLGGTVSGLVDYKAEAGGPPVGTARVAIKGLTRSGLVLTSAPIDVALVATLDAASVQARAVLREGGAVRGRVQARIGNLPSGGALGDRLRAGTLAAQLRYSGPAESLWRLAALDAFDLTGPLGVVADVTGNLDQPVIRGAVSSTALRLQSSLSGTDLQGLSVNGSFDGSRLALTGFSGRTPGGGTVSGSGMVDLSNVAALGVGLDLKVAANRATVLNRDDIKATVTGPLRIVSDGNGGTLAGRLRIDRGSWALGKAGVPVAALPVIRTREVNLPADSAPPRTPRAPWRYLIDAAAPQGFLVRGLGLDSEWGADVKLRGTTANPAILGRADLVRGRYEFAGKGFEVTRGVIRFTGESPPDPQLDIAATGDANGVTATIAITGTALRTAIAFTSTPALPEEELLSRLLFGSSITQISAPEALQLAAAVASLRGGGGLDPINRIRSAIGLDRLRVVGADAATGRGTAIAVGKYIRRRLFVELVTDGRGYSATSLEYRITRWLALLGTISSVAGGQSVNLKASKDY